MNITVLNYLDHDLAEKIANEAVERASAENAAKEAALSTGTDFSTVLNESSAAYNNTTSSSVSTYPSDLDSIFEEAATTYGVSSLLLKSIARAESNFNPSAVSSAGAVGVMQLMPATAASLGVTNSYDPYQNIMGGAKLMSQLLSKYNGNTVLALAAYNAGSGNVDKYGGIPPFTETQNYVRKVVSYMNGGFTASDNISAASTSTTDSSVDARTLLTQALSNAAINRGFSKNTLDLLASLLTQSATTNTTTVTDTVTPTTSTDVSDTTTVVPDTVVPDTSTPVVTEPNTSDVVVPEVITPEVITPETSDKPVSDVTDEVIPDVSDEVTPEVVVPDTQVSEEQIPEEQISEEQLSEEQISEEQTPAEQVPEESLS